MHCFSSSLLHCRILTTLTMLLAMRTHAVITQTHTRSTETSPKPQTMTSASTVIGSTSFTTDPTPWPVNTLSLCQACCRGAPVVCVLVLCFTCLSEFRLRSNCLSLSPSLSVPRSHPFSLSLSCNTLSISTNAYDASHMYTQIRTHTGMWPTWLRSPAWAGASWWSTSSFAWVSSFGASTCSRCVCVCVLLYPSLQTYLVTAFSLRALFCLRSLHSCIFSQVLNVCALTSLHRECNSSATCSCLSSW